MKKLKLTLSPILFTCMATLFCANLIFGQTKNTGPNLGEPKFTATGELDIRPSATSSKNDFNFLVGKWMLRDKKLKSRLTNSDDWIEFASTVEMQMLLNGIGNMDTYKTTLDGK